MITTQVGDNSVDSADMYHLPQIPDFSAGSQLPMRYASQEMMRPSSIFKFQWPEVRDLQSTKSDKCIATGEALHQPLTSDAAWLSDVLTELEKIDEEIAEEELPEIRSTTKKEARRIIEALTGHPVAPTVYPTQDGELAIHFKSLGSPNATVILLNNDAGADCYSHTKGRNRRAHYDDSSELPDDFVRAQLRTLRQLAVDNS